MFLLRYFLLRRLLLSLHSMITKKETIMIENPFEFGRTVDGDIVSFNDPFFKLWIRRNIAQL